MRRHTLILVAIAALVAVGAWSVFGSESRTVARPAAAERAVAPTDPVPGAVGPAVSTEPARAHADDRAAINAPDTSDPNDAATMGDAGAHGAVTLSIELVVRGRVVAEGQGVSDATVWKIGRAGPAEVATTDAGGRFEFVFASRAEFEPGALGAFHARHGMASVVPCPEPVAPSVDEVVDLTLRDAFGSVTGRVLDASGQPASALTLALTALDPSALPPWEVGVATARIDTDRQGRFCARGLRPGAWAVGAVPGAVLGGGAVMPRATTETGAAPIELRLPLVRFSVEIRGGRVRRGLRGAVNGWSEALAPAAARAGSLGHPLDPPEPDAGRVEFVDRERVWGIPGTFAILASRVPGLEGARLQFRVPARFRRFALRVAGTPTGLHVHVVDADGRPTDAAVRITRSGVAAPPVAWQRTQREAWPLAVGRYRVEAIVRGRAFGDDLVPWSTVVTPTVVDVAVGDAGHVTLHARPAARIALSIQQAQDLVGPPGASTGTIDLLARIRSGLAQDDVVLTDGAAGRLRAVRGVPFDPGGTHRLWIGRALPPGAHVLVLARAEGRSLEIPLTLEAGERVVRVRVESDGRLVVPSD